MVKGFSPTQIALHWGVALLIIYNLLMGDDMSGVARAFNRSGTLEMTTGAWVHIIVGTLVLAVVPWRLALRLTRGVPAAPPGSRLMTLAGEAGHWLLYVLMVAMPGTGLLAWYGGITSLGDLHSELLKVVLWLLISLHVAAAIYHHFVLKDGLLNRMRKAG